MSRCRCNDITGTEQKIQKIKDAKRIVHSYESRKGNLANELMRVLYCAREATESEAIADCYRVIYTLGDDMETVAGGIMSKLSSRLTELERDLRSMREEDCEYHEEQVKFNVADLANRNVYR